MLRRIYVGVPEQDKEVVVDDCKTVETVLKENNVTINGIVQHNGTSIAKTNLSKTLAELGVVDNDTIFVVKKLDNA